MWNDCKSIILSRLFVIIFILLLIATVVLAPWLTEKLISISRSDFSGTRTYFLMTVYTGMIPAALLLISLFRLLRRIESGLVFIGRNVDNLRHISWCCFLGAIICFVSAFYYFPWVFIGVAASFMGLIVRVVKNVFSRAVSLQDEADFTI